MAMQPRRPEEAPTRQQVVRAVRILGAINVAISAYMILGAVAIWVGGSHLPLTADVQVGLSIGMVVVAVVWGTGILGGVGLLLLAPWGRKAGYWWGKVIVWVLPIAFGLASRSLKAFFSLQFLLIIVLCVYAMIMANNLARRDFDVAFEK
jgi:hypothetical protein